jgi:hypothetical protein
MHTPSCRHTAGALPIRRAAPLASSMTRESILDEMLNDMRTGGIRGVLPGQWAERYPRRDCSGRQL